MTCTSSSRARSEAATSRPMKLARIDIDAGDSRLQAQVDPRVGVKALVPQRYPLFRRSAGEVVLGQVGSVDGRRRVVAQHHDAALEPPATQHFRGRETRRAAAD